MTMSEPTTMRACGSCRFWCKGSSQPRNKAQYTDEGGECRKYTPRGGRFDVYQTKGSKKDPDLVSIVCFPFPPTHQFDWCGEWEEASAMSPAMSGGARE